MPARTSTRLARTSAASTTKTKRTSSARRSANAVDIPDEGPVTSLRTQIAHVFADAQKETATQRKLIINLRKIQEACCFEPPSTGRGRKQGEEQDDFGEEDFNAEVQRCVVRILGIKKSEPAGDRLKNFLVQFLKLATEKDNAIFVAAEGAEEDEGLLHETPSSRLVSQIIRAALRLFGSKEKTVRFRATQLVVHIVSNLNAIDNVDFKRIRRGALKHLHDKEPSVRIQAALCLGRCLDDDDDDDEDDEEDDDEDSEDEDDDESVLDKLLDTMMNDPSAEVRRVVLQNCPLSQSTLQYILERARDMDPLNRRLVYSKCLPTLGDFRHLKLVQREKLIRWGLRDRDENVRKATARLFRERWLEDCASHHDNRPEEEKKPGEAAPPNMEALCELLERIEVIHTGQEDGIAHDAMREFWKGRPDYCEATTFDHAFWGNLNAENAFVVRSFNDYCHDAADTRAKELIEDRMPEVSMFAFVLQKELRALMDLVQKSALMEVMEEDGSEYEQVQELAEEKDFIVQQLLHIAKTLDYADHLGRQQMYNIMRDAIAKPTLPEECTKLAIEVLRTLCGDRNESEFCALIWEAITEVRDSLVDADDEATAEESDMEESFHSAHSEADAPIRGKPAKSGKELTAEEEEERRQREINVYSKCLHIAQCTLQNVYCDLEPETSLNNMLNQLIIPAVQAHDVTIRELGTICLGLACLLSKDLAASNLDLFLYIFTKGHDGLKMIVVQILTDIFTTNPQLLAPPPMDPDATEEDAEPTNPLVRPITKLLLKAFNHSENKRMNHVACTAASKFLLFGVLPPEQMADILVAFTLTYFDPETANNPALRQTLSYFLPVFCHSKLKNAHLMAEVAVPIVSKLLTMRAVTLDEEADDMVSWPVIAAHLSDWTDGRKVVGATELDEDGKTTVSAEAEEPHIQLSIAILERALASTCTREQRKPLLSLLSKLFIAPSSTAKKTDKCTVGESLTTLHELLTEVLDDESKTDATQRKTLTKLENTVAKRLSELDQPRQAAGEQTEVTPSAAPSPSQTEVMMDDRSQADATELAEVQDVDGSEIGDEEEEDDDTTMLAGMQGEGTRMPLEDYEDDTDDSAIPAQKRMRPTITEDDIMEDLLASELE
ncbi:chromosome condensation complex Condensin, subunit G [Pleosporales sp. CAS-2024a]